MKMKVPEHIQYPISWNVILGKILDKYFRRNNQYSSTVRQMMSHREIEWKEHWTPHAEALRLIEEGLAFATERTHQAVEVSLF